MEGLLELTAQGVSETSKLFKYVSCIKVNGRPILPPLMTPEKRKEMSAYREMAIVVENKIQSRCRDSISSDGIITVENKSTPARPATLNIGKPQEAQRSQSKGYSNTLEHRLALDSESETESERKRWSPLKVDSLNDLRLQGAADSDSAQDTPDTVTASPRPHLLRQSSYTIIQPSPALLQSHSGSQNLNMTCSGRPNFHASQPNLANSSHHPTTPGTDLGDFFESEKQQQLRSNSGRRTWDLTKAREKWTSSRGLGSESDESRPITPALSRNGGSEIRGRTHPRPNSVPSTDRVPSECSEPKLSVASTVREQLGCLSDMMIALTLRHEKQRHELKLQQEAEREKYEQLFTYKQRQILQSMSWKDPQSLPTSFCARDDVSFNSEPVLQMSIKRPHSAREVLSDNRHLKQSEETRDEEGGALDTDIDVSIMEEPCPVKDIGDVSDAYSLSSRSSTVSFEPVVPALQRNGTFKVYSSSNMERYNKAASVINAGVRGYLTRRLMRTEQVRALRRSLMDSLQVCRTLKTAPDLGSSDVNFMTSLQRQIFSDWDALYDIFLHKNIIDQLEMISLDRERMRCQKKSGQDSGRRRMSAATVRCLQRKQKGMSTSLTLPPSPSFKRSCLKMSASLSGALPPRNSCK